MGLKNTSFKKKKHFMVKGIHCFTGEYPFVVKLINT